MIPLQDVIALPEFQSANEEQRNLVLAEYANDFWREVVRDPSYSQAEEEEKLSLQQNFDSMFGQSTREMIETQIEGESRGFLENMWELVKKGGRNLADAERLMDDVATGEIDANTAAILAKGIREESKDYTPPELEEAQVEAGELTKSWEKAEGLTGKSKALWDTVKFVAGQTFGNPKGVAYLTAEQAANMIPGVAGTVAGSAVGAVAGTPFGLGGAGKKAGAAVGSFLGQWGIEAGSEFKGMIAAELNKRQLEPTEDNVISLLADDEFIEETISKARSKATATAAVSTAMNLAAGRLLAKPYNKAISEATQQLGAGATKEAVRDLAKQMLKARSIPSKLGAVAASAGTQLLEEPASEAAGQVAKGDFQLGEVAMETLGGAGGLVTELPAAAQAFKTPIQVQPGAQVVQPPTPPPGESAPPSAGILESESLDDAIAKFKSAVRKPDATPEGPGGDPPGGTAYDSAKVFQEAGLTDIERDIEASNQAEIARKTRQEDLEFAFSQDAPRPVDESTPENNEPVRHIGDNLASLLTDSRPWRSAQESASILEQMPENDTEVKLKSREDSSSSDYFEKNPNSQTVEISKLIPINKEISQEKLSSAQTRMDAAKEGAGPKRSPLKVVVRDDGTMKVIDGNTTLRELSSRGAKHAEVEAVSKIRQSKSVSKNMDTLYQNAREAVGGINERVTQLANETNGKVKLRPFADGLKKRETAELKLKNKYGGNVSMVDDIVATTVVYPDYKSMKEAFSKIQKQDDVLSWNNRYDQESIGGYQDMQLTMRAENGHIYELQLNTEPMIEAKKKLHSLYKVIGHLTHDNFDEETKTATLDMLNNLMDRGYAAAASLARGKSDQSVDDFRSGLSDLANDSAKILSLVAGSVTSDRLSPSTKKTLFDFVSRTNVSLPDSKNTSISTSSEKGSLSVSTLINREEKVNNNNEEEFSGNKIFTKAKVDKARARMKGKRGQLNSGVDPEALSDLIVVGGAYFERGVRDIATWSVEMVKEFGEKVRPLLKEGYDILTKHPLFADDTLDNYKDWEPETTAGGQYKGAPSWVKTPEDLVKMRDTVASLVDEGKVGRYWYEKSADAIMELMQGDVAKAEKFIQLIAIYSPQARVDTNTTFAISAWIQYTSGTPREDFKVKTAEQDKKAIGALYDNKPFPYEGRKTNSFYLNLLHEIIVSKPGSVAKMTLDRNILREMGRKATIDLWMLRAFGYDLNVASNDKGTGKYSFSEKEIVRLADRMNEKDGTDWTPFQVQAAIWSAMKARYEDPQVKADTWAESIGAGLASVDDKGRFVLPTEKEGLAKHRDIWRKNALNLSSEKATENANKSAADFSHFIQKNIQVITWEAVPSTKLSHEILGASPMVKRMFTDEARRIIVQDDADTLAHKVGVHIAYVTPGEGAYAGGVNPNNISHLIPARVNREIPVSNVSMYARAVQYIFKQDAVPWFRANQFAMSSKAAVEEQMFRVVNESSGKVIKNGKFENLNDAMEHSAKNPGTVVRGGPNARGVVVAFDKPITPADNEKILQRLSMFVGDGAGYTRTGENEITIINFRNDETRIPYIEDSIFLGNVQSFIDNNLDSLAIKDANSIWAQGEYGYDHNWNEDPEGQAVINHRSLAGQPDLQSWIRDRRADFEKVLERYSGKQLTQREREAEAIAKFTGEDIGSRVPLDSDNAIGFGGGVVTSEESFSPAPTPKKSITAYKLFRTSSKSPGQIFPLFIGKNTPTPIGRWIQAEFIPTKGYATRPGWHAGVLPTAPHLMKKDGTMQADRVWAEVEISADRNYQGEADASSTRDIRERIPSGGFYRFKTNKMQGGAWIIGGAMKVNRLLSADEVSDIVSRGEPKFQMAQLTLPVDQNGNVTLAHWSKISGLKTIDPAKYSTGIAGAEARRKAGDPENWVDRSYYGVVGGGYVKEVGLGQYRYDVTVKAENLYDFQADPDGLMAQAAQERAGNPFADKMNIYERLIRDSGYTGYWSTRNNQVIAAVFAPLKAGVATEQAQPGIKLQQTKRGGVSQTPTEAFGRLLGSLNGDQAGVAKRLVSSGKVVLMSNDEAMKELEGMGYSLAEMGEGNRPIGIEVPGKTILVPENIPDGELWGSLRHAIGTHIGRMMQGNAEFQMIKKTIMRRADEQSRTGEAIRRAMAQVPEDTTPENYSEEVLAYMVSTSEDIGLVRRIIAMIKNFITRFGVSYKIFNEQDFKALADLAIRREARGNTETFFSEDDLVKFQMAGSQSALASTTKEDIDAGIAYLTEKYPGKYEFVGRTGQFIVAVKNGFVPKNERISTLVEAKAMKEDGIDRSEIWRKTGWWEMIPGEWQYEIDDSEGKVDVNQYGKLEPGEAISISKLYKHPTIYSLYPQLKTVKVTPIKAKPGQLGAWDFEKRILLLNQSLSPDEIQSTVIHEVQHIIQDIENFARGGSFETQYGKIQIKAEMLIRRIVLINGALTEIANKSKFGQLSQEERATYSSLRQIRDRLAVEHIQLTDDPVGAGFRDYRLLTGEVSARLVQARQKLSQAERRSIPPWQHMEAMLRGEGLLKFGEDPQDVLLTKYDPSIPGSIIHAPSQPQSISFLDRIKGQFDFQGWFDEFATWLYNQDKAIERVQQGIGPQPTSRDYSTIRGLVGKRLAAEVKRFDIDVYQPLIQFIVDSKLKLEDVQEFLHAEHAPERNLQMRRANARGYIDALMAQMTDKEREQWQGELGDIQDDFVMNSRALDEKRDNLVSMLERMGGVIAGQRAQIDQIAADLQARQWTPAEIAKGTDVYWQKRLDNMYYRLGKRESIVNEWDSRKGKLSGMTDAEAKKVVKQWAGHTAMNEAARKIRAINEEALRIAYSSGDLTDEEYTNISSRYKYHVPLFREEVDEGKAPTGRSGRGPLGKPPQAQVAAGSTKAVVNILAHIVDRYQASLSRRLKLEAERALYDMVTANPNEELWSIAQMAKAPYHDHEGNIRFYPDQQIDLRYQTYVKVDGVKHIIEVAKDNPQAVRFMEALNRQTTDPGPVLKASRVITRILARLNTSLTPEFALPNFTRDLQTAFVNMSGTEASGLQMKVFGNIRHAIAGIYREERGKPSGQWGAIYKDAAAHGVVMGWAQSYEDVKQLAEQIEYDIATKEGGHKVRENFKRLGNFIESVNLSVENGVRVATYKALVDRGTDKLQAGRIASNLTIDFTKHGTAGPTINAAWMFANAGIQGNIRMMQAVSSSAKVQKIVTGIVGLGIAVNLLGAAAGGDDEDGESRYDKLKRTNPGLFERNMIFFVPGGDGLHVRFPMAYGYNIFFKFGDEIATILRGGNPVEAGLRWGTTVMNNLNPLAAGTLLQTVMPTVLDPMAQIIENKAWHGGNLMPPLNPWMNQPDSERYYKDVNPVSREVTKWLNEMTGGSKFREGMISVSPESIEMVLETIAGGAGRVVKDTLNLPFAIAEGDVSIKNVPIIRRFAGVMPESIDRRVYSENRDEMKTFVLELKNATREERPSLVREPVYKLVGKFQDTEKRLDELHKMKKQIEANGKDAGKIDERINAIQVEFNKRYNQITGRD